MKREKSFFVDRTTMRDIPLIFKYLVVPFHETTLTSAWVAIRKKYYFWVAQKII